MYTQAIHAHLPVATYTRFYVLVHTYRRTYVQTYVCIRYTVHVHLLCETPYLLSVGKEQAQRLADALSAQVGKSAVSV